jgi:glutathione S-transferase
MLCWQQRPRSIDPPPSQASHRVPILRHGDFTVYETSAIVAYLEEAFPKLALQPKSVRDRARMNQWISAVNSYYYPYMIYHVSHEPNVFPELGIPTDEKVVAHALPKIETGLQVLERELVHGKTCLLGSELTLATICCPVATRSASRRKQRLCIRNIPPSPAGARAWKASRPSRSFARPSRRARRSSTRGNGPCRTARNTKYQSQPGAEARSALPAHIRRGI